MGAQERLADGPFSMPQLCTTVVSGWNRVWLRHRCVEAQRRRSRRFHCRLCAVSIKPCMGAERSVPARVRKQSAIFICSLVMRRARSVVHEGHGGVGHEQQAGAPQRPQSLGQVVAAATSAGRRGQALAEGLELQQVVADQLRGRGGGGDRGGIPWVESDPGNLPHDFSLQ